MSKFGLLSILIGLPAFALSTAKMQLPEELEAQSDSIRIAGFGGRNKGTFQMPGFSGELLGARLIVGRPKADNIKERFLARDLRRGESVIFEQHLVIESVHNYKGTKLQSQPPVGYLLRQDERPVAALELTDVNPTLIVSFEIADELRRSVLATALALAVLRDPADSALEE